MFFGVFLFLSVGGPCVLGFCESQHQEEIKKTLTKVREKAAACSLQVLLFTGFRFGGLEIVGI